MNENFSGQSFNEQNNFNGGHQVPNGQQPPTFDGQQPPTFGDNMWGNEEFAGEEIFHGDENFANGAPPEISEFVDPGANNASDFSEQRSPFGQGGMMPQMFGGQGGQFNGSQQPQQNQFK